MNEREAITLGIAVWGAVTGTLGLVLGRRESKWKRRHASLAPLRPMIEQLGVPLANANDPQIVRNLFSLTFAADLAALQAGKDELPDWRTKRHVGRLVAAVIAFRGGGQPEQADGSPSALSAAQVKELERAKASLAKVEKRMAKTAKKGRF